MNPFLLLALILILIITRLLLQGLDKPYQLSGLVVRVSALRLGGRGSTPGRVIPKTLIMGPSASLLGTQHQGLDWGRSLRHTSVMSRGCTCTSSCLTLRKQEIGSCPMGLRARQGLPTYLPIYSKICNNVEDFSKIADLQAHSAMNVYMCYF